MMKLRMRALMMAILLLTGSVMAMADNANIEIGGVNYILDEATMTASVGKSNDATGDIVLPQSVTYNGKAYTVTSIDKEAFLFSYRITSIELPSSMETIGENAFALSHGLSSIKLNEGLKTIGNFAFFDCKEITSIDIPSSVTSIGERAFADCKIVTSITIPAGVTSLGANPFMGCKMLNTIKVEEGNKVYDSRDNSNTIIETATNKLITACSASTIPYGVEAIGDHAVEELDITKIDIPATVTTIGEEAFRECHKLTSVEIPASVKLIKYRAFDECNSLKDVYIYGTEGIECGRYAFDFISDDAVLHVDASLVGWYHADEDWNDFFDNIVAWEDAGENIGAEVDGINYSLNEATMTASVGYNEGASGLLVLPQSVTYNGKTYALTSIGNHAFFNCKDLTQITLPSGVKTIEQGAFEHCEGLVSINMPDGLKSIGHHAFYHCSSLTAIELPGTVDTIGDWAFEDCEELRSANIPDGVKTIGEKTFSGCFSLASIEIPSSVTSIGKAAFSFCNLESLAIPGSVVSIGENAFYSCGVLTSLTLNEGLKTIGESAFDTCESLESLSIPASVESIGTEFIAQCNALKSVKVEEGNKVYDSRNNCNAVVETATNTLIAGCNATTIPYGIESLGYRAFSVCMEMTSIDIPSSVTSIGEEAFAYCTALTSANIPASVTSMGINPFYNCENLEAIVVDKDNKTFDSRENGNAIIETATNKLISACRTTHIPDGVAAIGQEAFAGLDITTIDIPATVTSIEKNAFRFCNNLTSVKIPEGVTTVGESAFTQCWSLTSVEIPSSVTRIDQFAFEYCKDLPSVTIPASVTFIDEWAFKCCESLKDVYLLGTEVKNCGINSFSGIPDDAVLHVDASLVSEYEYKSDGYWLLSFPKIVPLDATGIENIQAADGKQTFRIYSADGKQQDAMQKGINILRYKNGKTIKVVHK